MSDCYHHPSRHNPPSEYRATVEQKTMGSVDPVLALVNLADVRTRMDSLQRFLGDSINRNILLSKDEMDSVSSELVSAIHQVVVNGTALLSSSQPHPIQPDSNPNRNPNPNLNSAKEELEEEEQEPVEAMDGDDDDVEIVELDAVELLAEHIHFCEICGKGFKRDANLRMHMRAHGNQFKTAEALSKPSSSTTAPAPAAGSSRRFSCPYQGCNRNQKHPNFRSLKSVVCVKNHFKRSHCPKMYSCNRCHKKSFSVLADLKSHLKNCGVASSRWKCSCGTTFSRKDKLFGHIALFDGHMPAHVDDKHKLTKDNPNPQEFELEEQFLLDDECFQDYLMSNTSASVSSSADFNSNLMDQFFNF